MKKKIGVMLLVLMICLSGCGSKTNGQESAEVQVTENDSASDSKIDEEPVTSVDTQSDSKIDEEPVTSVDTQMQVIAENKEVWFAELDYANELKKCMVTDLNGNGRLEIVASQFGGTGCFTYSSYYEVDEDYSGLTKYEINGEDEVSQVDIMDYEEANAYEDNGIYYYVLNDYNPLAANEYYVGTRALSLQSGTVLEESIRYQVEKYEDADTSKITYYNTNEEEITEEEYQAAEDNLFSGLPKYKVTFGWIEKSELLSLDTEELAGKLAESYEKFAVSFVE